MSHVKSAGIIGILVAIGMARLYLPAPYSSVLIFPLFPGMVAGLFFSGHGGNMPVAILSCWIVDTGLYWLVWMLVSRIFRKLVTRPS
jgi:hypothetical protein